MPTRNDPSERLIGKPDQYTSQVQLTVRSQVSQLDHVCAGITYAEKKSRRQRAKASRQARRKSR